MKPFGFHEHQFQYIDILIKQIPFISTDDFLSSLQENRWDEEYDNICFPSLHYGSDCNTSYSYYHYGNFIDWVDCPIRKRHQIINEIIDAPTGRTIGENAILK